MNSNGGQLTLESSFGVLCCLSFAVSGFRLVTCFRQWKWEEFSPERARHRQSGGCWQSPGHACWFGRLAGFLRFDVEGGFLCLWCPLCLAFSRSVCLKKHVRGVVVGSGAIAAGESRQANIMKCPARSWAEVKEMDGGRMS